ILGRYGVQLGEQGFAHVPGRPAGIHRRWRRRSDAGHPGQDHGHRQAAAIVVNAAVKIRRLLVANRSEIARRVIRTAHRMGMQTVAVHSDADARALHVREATTAYALGGNASADSYLRIDKLIAAARATGADAVHPGYGFLSENADFAQAVIDAGLVWVGPPPQAIRTLGSKSSAKQLALARGVPCLPGYQGNDDADSQSNARFTKEAQR